MVEKYNVDYTNLQYQTKEIGFHPVAGEEPLKSFKKESDVVTFFFFFLKPLWLQDGDRLIGEVGRKGHTEDEEFG